MPGTYPSAGVGRGPVNLALATRSLAGYGDGMLVDQIRDAMTAAMKQRDDLTVSTLRMTLAAVKAAEVSGKAARALSDDEVLAVIAKEAKKRLESAEAFKAAGRSELEAKERGEAQILAVYLPEALSPEEARDHRRRDHGRRRVHGHEPDGSGHESRQRQGGGTGRRQDGVRSGEGPPRNLKPARGSSRRRLLASLCLRPRLARVQTQRTRG